MSDVDCQRLDEATLISIASGEVAIADDEAHAASCEHCRERVAKYQRLAGAIGAMASDHKRPPEAIAQALETIAEPVRGWRHRRAMVAAVAAVLAIAAALAVFVLREPPTDTSVAFLSVSVSRSGERVRGQRANVGDRVHASVGTDTGTQIWVYFNDELKLSCPPKCAAQTRGSVELVLDRPGRYQILAIESSAGPSISLTAAIEAATRRDERSELRELEVR